MASLMSTRTQQFFSQILLRSRRLQPSNNSITSSAYRRILNNTNSRLQAQAQASEQGSLRRLFFTKRSQSSSPQNAAHEAKQAAASPGFRAKLTKLMRENGWVAVGIYTALSLLDFSACFVLVNAVGAEHVRKGEQWIWATLGYPPVIENEQEGGQQPEEKHQHHHHGEQSTVWTRLALAYTLHKTLLLPFRVGLTAWITPGTVRYVFMSPGQNLRFTC